MAAGESSLARMRKTLHRHARGGWQRVVFARPGGVDERVVEASSWAGVDDPLAALLAGATEAARAGLVKITLVLDECSRVQIDARHGAGKVIARDDATLDKQMGGKQRALRPDTSGELLRVIGIMNADGTISAKHAKKYKQVSHFVELCKPVWDALRGRREITVEAPLRVLDLGCGNGVLTFVIAEALRLQGLAARIVGVDVRDDVVERAQGRAQQLGWDELAFVRTSIADVADARELLGGAPDLVVALHACDTATDDALLLARAAGAAAILAAPCCQHELAGQLGAATVPVPAIAKHGLLLQDYAATLTDALRIEALLAWGYAVDTLEFVSDTHTPKNLLLRALLRGGPHPSALDALAQRCAALGVHPRILCPPPPPRDR
ncbi:MAG TPA: methyltransferase [Nannocystaceae bacterium]|nr:methyltransferase [Nannocystaceae bacterium]